MSRELHINHSHGPNLHEFHLRPCDGKESHLDQTKNKRYLSTQLLVEEWYKIQVPNENQLYGESVRFALKV